ncbi:methyl-CpG-binding domain-containing protein 10-like protein [Tanacetum coccineum]
MVNGERRIYRLKLEMSLMDKSWDQAPKEQCLLKKGGTPGTNKTVFTAPTGEEITTKKQLSQYLKSDPGQSLTGRVKDKKDKEDVPKEAGEKLEISDVPSEEVVNPASEVNDESNKEVDEEVREIPEVPSEEVPKKVNVVNEDLVNEEVLENPITPPPEEVTKPVTEEAAPVTKVEVGEPTSSENGCSSVEANKAKPSWEEITIE